MKLVSIEPSPALSCSFAKEALSAHHMAGFLNTEDGCGDS
jgi:hypothetical protein